MNRDVLKGIFIGIILTMLSCFMMGDIEIETDFKFDHNSNKESNDTSL